jgi:hypothetical protein
MMRTQLALAAHELRRVEFTNPSAISLLLANAVPLFGVLILGWSTFAIVVIYWAENVILGAINVLKMAVCSPLTEDSDLSQFDEDAIGNTIRAKLVEHGGKRKIVSRVHLAAKLFLIPFFVVHYGLFCFVHGIFVFDLLGGSFGLSGPFEFWSEAFERLRAEHLQWAVLALGASHLLSFFTNFVYRGEYRHVSAPQLMIRPYGRVVVLHMAILLGAFATFALGSPVWMLVILIIGKTILDMGLHLAERKKYSHGKHVEWAKKVAAEFVK